MIHSLQIMNRWTASIYCDLNLVVKVGKVKMEPLKKPVFTRAWWWGHIQFFISKATHVSWSNKCDPHTIFRNVLAHILEFVLLTYSKRVTRSLPGIYFSLESYLHYHAVRLQSLHEGVRILNFLVYAPEMQSSFTKIIHISLVKCPRWGDSILGDSFLATASRGSSG